MENGTVEKTVKRNYDFVDNKAKVKNYYQANRKDRQSIMEDGKIKKRNNAKSKNKIMSNVDREKRKEYPKSYYYQRKKFVTLFN